jgi:bifunctional UDP-N-acetylglucosamine pyrophosphorylase / glucosamine-1-phosphate N-acetyltransferase
VLPVLRAHERTVIAHELADPTEVEGINDRIALAELGARAQRRIAERHMLAGVTIVNPASGTSPRDRRSRWSRSVFTPA